MVLAIMLQGKFSLSLFPSGPLRPWSWLKLPLTETYSFTPHQTSIKKILKCQKDAASIDKDINYLYRLIRQKNNDKIMK